MADTALKRTISLLLFEQEKNEKFFSKANKPWSEGLDHQVLAA